MSLYSLYNKYDKFAHDYFRKRFAKRYSIKQLNDAKSNFTNWKTLSKEQKKQIANFWNMKHPRKCDFMTHEVMLNVTGKFDVSYCPEIIFRQYIDPGLSNRKFVWAWDDKNYFDRHQPILPFPYTYIRNVNGWFLDHDYNPIDVEQVKSIIKDNLPLLIKPSLISGEGKNIRLITTADEIDEVLSKYKKDFLLQEVIKQNEELNKLNSHSVNAMRIVTAIVDGKPVFLTGMILCNTTDAIACNTNKCPGEGVVMIGINDDGTLCDHGYYENAKYIDTLPNGFKFGGLKIPSYNEAVNLCLKAHKSMPFLGVIGWDVTIDQNNKPVFIEWNLRGIGMYHSQMISGPLFGQYTDYFVNVAQKLMSKK